MKTHQIEINNGFDWHLRASEWIKENFLLTIWLHSGYKGGKKENDFKILYEWNKSLVQISCYYLYWRHLTERNFHPLAIMIILKHIWLVYSYLLFILLLPSPPVLNWWNNFCFFFLLFFLLFTLCVSFFFLWIFFFSLK